MRKWTLTQNTTRMEIGAKGVNLYGFHRHLVAGNSTCYGLFHTFVLSQCAVDEIRWTDSKRQMAVVAVAYMAPPPVEDASPITLVHE